MPSYRPHWRSLMAVFLLVLLVALAPLSAPVQAEEDDPTADSAVYLMRKSVEVSRKGRHNSMIAALRHLRDPQLLPLFEHLAKSPHPALKIHGLLGKAECEGAKLNLEVVKELYSAPMQAQVIGVALDSDLLTPDDAKAVLDWPNVELGLRLLVMLRLTAADAAADPTPLKNLDGEKPDLGQRGLAAAVRLQLGDRSAMTELEALDNSTERDRDKLREHLLDTAYHYDFDKLAPWAAKVATEPGVSSKLGLKAMRLAMRFNGPATVDLWKQELSSSTDAVHRTRLAIIGLQLAPFLPASAYESLRQDDDLLLQRIGAAAHAIASKRPATKELTELVELYHPIVCQWAMSFAKDEATPEQATTIYRELVLKFKLSRRQLARRIDLAVTAAERLAEHNPDEAVAVLWPLLADHEKSEVLRESVLLGLVKARSPRLAPFIAQIKPGTKPELRGLRALLLALHEQPLSENEGSDLAVIARGGMTLPPTIRLFAAWTYLKRTGRIGWTFKQILD